MSNLALRVDPGIVRGAPYIDPNSGFQTQALGYRAALDWLAGIVPWWNPYSGVGLPLAGEYQPSAFLPLTFLLLLPRGAVWLQLALQMLSGWGAYALLRQLGTGRLAATTGGMLYAFNGTLAWFAHGPASVVPFLPWMLLGVERAFAAAQLRGEGGWRTLAIALALSLLAGFPETAYIGGLLALAWTILRGVQTTPGHRAGFARRIAIGGVVGIAAAAPQVWAFFQFLPLAHLGGHEDVFSRIGLHHPAVIPSLVAPYAFGPIFGYADVWPLLNNIWGSIGGYVSAAVVVAAVYGALARRGALSALLAAWIVLALLKTFAIEPATTLWNLVPGISATAFFRYAQPSWELAFVILASLGIDAIASDERPRRAALVAAGLALLVALGGGLLYGMQLWPQLRAGAGLRNSALGSAAWATLTAVACFAFLARPSWSRRGAALAAVLVVDAMLLFAIPALSIPRAGPIDTAAVEFLRGHLGLQRFHSLGPIAPNYSAYFGIASINHNYLPLDRRWAQWVAANLDAHLTDPVVFDGKRFAGDHTASQELRRNLGAYQQAAVKFVVAPGESDPFATGPGTRDESVRKVYRDALLTIYELPEPKPYFEAVSGPCTVRASERTAASVECAAPGILVRRELYFPGWSASVDGIEARISEYGGLFQAIEVPAGRSEVRFRFAPPHVEWAWLAMLLAILSLAAPPIKLPWTKG
ncbi:MAG: hypothetical protein ACXWG8_09570 [Usitatibacter sp.]